MGPQLVSTWKTRTGVTSDPGNDNDGKLSCMLDDEWGAS